MISIETLMLLVWMHFVADFVLQTDEMAQRKSKENKWLLFHTTVYIIPFMIFGWMFALVNWAAHTITDYITSRATSYLYKKEKRHWFFVVVGLDQYIHITTLVLTYKWLF